MNSQDKAKYLLDMLKTKEDIESKLKQLNKEIIIKSMELHDQMVDEECDTVTVAGIKFEPVVETNFALTEEFDGVNWDDCEEFFSWLKKIGEDGAIKTKASVHHATRARILKDYIADGNPLPEWIAEKLFSTVKYNKSAIKRMVQEVGDGGQE